MNNSEGVRDVHEQPEMTLRTKGLMIQKNKKRVLKIDWRELAGYIEVSNESA